MACSTLPVSNAGWVRLLVISKSDFGVIMTLTSVPSMLLVRSVGGDEGGVVLVVVMILE